MRIEVISMIANILESCQKINIEVSLFQLLEFFIVIVIITLVILLQRIIVRTVRKESMIDARLRETSARIIRVVAEIEESKEHVSDEESLNGQDINSETASNDGTKIKKTRAMSMEERWADFEKKRAKNKGNFNEAEYYESPV
jgi:signal transduction histidine kinase